MQNNTLSRPGFSLSGTALKRIACLSMLLDHIGASLLENGLFKQGAFWPGDVQLDGVLRLASGPSTGPSSRASTGGIRMSISPSCWGCWP